ncbi:serine hydrolase [Thalassospira sp.]|uniref:serine hydrolase n=1 Tax=Thalassospira sp. TaxID=1912094 RepID=UPI000C417E6E|nr:serine hydrolase [Thalassospira sp.]MBC06959.1 serine hydrolase [Thalassospira sp.]|tara:strand:+ start:3193 stop:4743 length:1551 start_codon:yes stop_codon:yes gene_type:complete
MRAAILLVSLALAGPVHAQGVTPGSIPSSDVAPLADGGFVKAIDTLPEMVETVMARSGVPGMAVAIVKDGKVVFRQGFGVRDIRDPKPVTPETVFQVASVSKSVSASVAAVAVTNGLVSWDDPVGHHLAGFELSDPFVSTHATLGDFFAHRSGLPFAAGDDLEDIGYDRQQIISRLKYLPLDPFRISYHYANFGLTVGAEAIAEAAGMKWADFAEKALFEPVGMDATSYRYSDAMAAENRAVLHAYEDGKFVALYDRNADAQSPAGGLSSTVDDLAKWMTLLLSDGKWHDKQLIASAALAPAIRPQITSAPGATQNDRSGAYGYGFNVGTTASGRPIRNHSGGFIKGAGTHFKLLTDAGIGIVVVSNGAPIGASEAIASQFMDVVQFGETTRDWFAGYSAMMSPMFAPVGDLVGKPAPQNPVPAAEAGIYTGRFENDYFGAAEIVQTQDGLELHLGPKPMEMKLSHWDGHTFSIAPLGENQPKGSLSSVTFAVENNRATAVRIEYLDDAKQGTWRR